MQLTGSALLHFQPAPPVTDTNSSADGRSSETTMPGRIVETPVLVTTRPYEYVSPVCTVEPSATSSVLTIWTPPVRDTGVDSQSTLLSSVAGHGGFVVVSSWVVTDALLT